MEISYFKNLKRSLEIYNLPVEKFIVIKDFIRNLGIPINLTGYKYIVKSLMIMLSSEKILFLNELYQEISKLYNISKESVEIAIRNAIKKAIVFDEQKVRNILGVHNGIKISNSVFLNTARNILLENLLKTC